MTTREIAARRSARLRRKGPPAVSPQFLHRRHRLEKARLDAHQAVLDAQAELAKAKKTEEASSR